MTEYIFVFFGGGLGAISRYWLGGLINKNIVHAIPFGTLSVNVLGSLLIGFLLTIGENREMAFTQWRSFLIVGFLGGFTTFSAFSWETLALFRYGHYVEAVVYVLANIAFSLMGVVLGFWLGKN